MPFTQPEKTVEPVDGVLFIKLFPHPLDLKALAANGGTLPVGYKPKSCFRTAYGEFESQEAYEATPAGEFPQPRAQTKTFGASGEAVRDITNHTSFHALCSALIAGLLSGAITEDAVNADEARVALDGRTADLGFGTTPFVVQAPE